MLIEPENVADRSEGKFVFTGLHFVMNFYGTVQRAI